MYKPRFTGKKKKSSKVKHKFNKDGTPIFPQERIEDIAVSADEVLEEAEAANEAEAVEEVEAANETLHAEDFEETQEEIVKDEAFEEEIEESEAEDVEETEEAEDIEEIEEDFQEEQEEILARVLSVICVCP